MLSKAGYEIKIISPHHHSLSINQETDGISIYRYISPAANRFLGNLILAPVLSSFVLLWVWLRHGLDVLYVFNPPDTLTLVGLLPKLAGKTLIFDIRDPLPEFYATEFKRSKGLLYVLLCWLERLATRFATHITVTNETCRQLVLDRDGIPAENVSVIPIGPDLEKIKPTEPDAHLRERAKTILAFLTNGFKWDGADHLLKALNILKNSYSYEDWFCLLIGLSEENGNLTDLAEELDIEDHLWFAGSQPVEKWPMLLSSADICIDPAPANPLNEIKTSQSILNYMAVGKPIVAYDFPKNRKTAGEAAVYPQADDMVDLAGQILHLVDNPELRSEMGEIGRARVESQLAISSKEEPLIALVNKLTNWDSVSQLEQLKPVEN
jgi:glycosyltransferase involved in cell wall biosynthesis